MLLAFSHAEGIRYAKYVHGRVFKLLSVERSIEHIGIYIDGLKRNEELDKADKEIYIGHMINKPNQEIIMSILNRWQNHQNLIFFAKEFVKYLEAQGIAYFVDKTS